MHINLKMKTVTSWLNRGVILALLHTNELKVCDKEHLLGISSGCLAGPERRRCPLRLVPFWTPPGRQAREQLWRSVTAHTVTLGLLTGSLSDVEIRDNGKTYLKLLRVEEDEMLNKTDEKHRRSIMLFTCKIINLSWNNKACILKHWRRNGWNSQKLLYFANCKYLVKM